MNAYTGYSTSNLEWHFPKKMRLYDIVSGILFIVSIIDFALAAPVLVQEKRQACLYVVQIPKDVITVLEKRVDEGAQELERLLDKYFKAIGNPAESSDAHTSIPILESSGVYPPSIFAPQGLERGSTPTNVVQAHGGSKPLESPIRGSSEMHSSSSFAPPGPVRGSTSTNVVQAPAPYANPDRLVEPSGPSGAAPMQGP